MLKGSLCVHMCARSVNIYYSVSSSFVWSHRVLRHTVFICASRSLSVQASAFRSSIPPHHVLNDKGGGGTLVFIDVENLNTVRYTAWKNTYIVSWPAYYRLSFFNLYPSGSRVMLVCLSFTSFRFPAVVNTGTSTSVSTRPRRKVGMAHWFWIFCASSNTFFQFKYQFLNSQNTVTDMKVIFHFSPRRQ